MFEVNIYVRYCGWLSPTRLFLGCRTPAHNQIQLTCITTESLGSMWFIVTFSGQLIHYLIHMIHWLVQKFLLFLMTLKKNVMYTHAHRCSQRGSRALSHIIPALSLLMRRIVTFDLSWWGCDGSQGVPVSRDDDIHILIEKTLHFLH